MKIVLICLFLINLYHIKCSDPLGIINGIHFSGNAPFFVGITYAEGIPFCGGTLYSEYKVLTAAHCFNKTRIYEFGTVFVKYGTKMREGAINLVAVKKVIMHPLARKLPTISISDLAVLILDSPISEGPNVSYAEFELEKINNGEKLTFYGWGRTNYDPPDWNKELLKAEFMFGGCIYDRIYCISSRQVACYGDSGGPLVTSKGKVCGVLKSSYEEDCSVGINYFTQIRIYIDWIKKQ